ncbi:MAG: FHA domain-containing protein [Planctomycetota bacterium]|nr:FHA domain-containing protein [Planctomycetota bacterium]
MAQIIIRYEGKESIVPLTAENTLIGRSAKNQVMLKDASLSREHCAVVRGADGLYSVKDLGSRNGTLVNSEKLGEGALKKLEVGDKIEIGATMIIFEYPVPGRAYDPKAAGEKSDMPGPAVQKIADTTVLKAHATKPADFASWKPRAVDPGHLLIGLGIAMYVALVCLLLFWRPRRQTVEVTAGGGLLGGDGGFETGADLGKCPDSCACSDDTEAKTTMAERKSGERSLLVERLADKLVPSFCTYSRRFEVADGKRYRLLGWVSGACPEMPAGVRFRWFVGDEDLLPLDETFVLGEQVGQGWERLPAVVVAPPPSVSAFDVALVLTGIEGKAYFDDLRLEETDLEDTLHLRSSKGTFSVHATPGGVFGFERGSGLVVTCLSLFADKGGNLSEQLGMGLGSWVTSPREGAEPLLLFAGDIPDPAGLESLKVRTSVDFLAAGIEVRYSIHGGRAEELDSVGVAFRVPAALVSKRLVVTRGNVEEPARGKSEISGVDSIKIGAGDDALVLGFSMPMGIKLSQTGSVWECRARVAATSSSFISLFKAEEGLVMTLATEKEMAAQTPVAANAAGLKDAMAAEASGRYGQALANYRKLAAGEAGKLSEDDRATAQRQATALEEKAATMIAGLQNAVRQGQLFGDQKTLGTACDGLREMASSFDGSEYAERARTLLGTAEAAKLDMARNAQRDEAERLLRTASGFLKEGRTTIARAFCEQVMAQFPESEWAKQAKDILDQLGQ